MLADLTGQQENLKNELMSLERDFNQKKEQFIRIQGAIEALGLVDGVTPPDTQSPTIPEPDVPVAESAVVPEA